MKSRSAVISILIPLFFFLLFGQHGVQATNNDSKDVAVIAGMGLVVIIAILYSRTDVLDSEEELLKIVSTNTDSLHKNFELFLAPRSAEGSVALVAGLKCSF